MLKVKTNIETLSSQFICTYHELTFGDAVKRDGMLSANDNTITILLFHNTNVF